MRVNKMNKNYLDLTGLEIYDIELKNYIRQQIQDIEASVVQYDTYLDFPSVGSENVIYIDITASEIYRWNEDDLHYYAISTNYNNIEIVNGCPVVTST